MANVLRSLESETEIDHCQREVHFLAARSLADIYRQTGDAEALREVEEIVEYYRGL